MTSIFSVSYYIFIDDNTSKYRRVSKSIWSRYHKTTSYFANAKSEVFVYDLGGNPDGFPLRPLSFRDLKRVVKSFW